jgi:four helix bundle protein
VKVEDMDVFKLAHDLTLQVYELTSTFPDHERYGLVSQMRRASSSICMNLMEGAHRAGRNEYKHSVSISRGSCGEVKYQLLLAKDLKYLPVERYQDLIAEFERTSMMLTKLYSSLK